MSRPSSERGERPEAPDGNGPTGFEVAQAELFDAVGLDVRSRFVDLTRPKGRVHVFETGGSDGTPAVFVHGTAAFGAFFAPLLAHLGDVRAVSFDRPGYGLSDPFTYTERDVRRSVVDVIEGVLDELEVERADVVGHSMGGHGGIAFALASPERVRRLVLVGAVPAFPGTRPPTPLRLLTAPLLGRVLRRLQRPGEAGVLDIASVFGERAAIENHPALIRAIAAHERDPSAAAAGASEFDALFSVRGWHPSVRLEEDELRGLQPPTTVILGENDPLGGPEAVRAGVELIPSARLHTLDAGHIPYLDHPERCARLVREG